MGSIIWLFMSYDVFISYSRKDSEVAGQIYNALQAQGLTCFIDLEGISGGTDFTDVIAGAIMESRLFLLLASEHAYASEFTRKEVTFAVNNKGSLFIFPLILDGTPLPKSLEFLLSNINWRTLSSRYRIEKELVADIKNKLENPHMGETLSQQNRNSFKKMVIWASILFALVLGGLLYPQVTSWYDNRALKMARQDKERCVQMLKGAEVELEKTKTLQSSVPSELERLQDEVDCLNRAELLLHRADSLTGYYQLPPAKFANEFSSEINRSQKIHARVDAQRDSTFASWKDSAIEMYRDENGVFEPDEILKYVNYALFIKPTDGELQSIKNELGK